MEKTLKDEEEVKIKNTDEDEGNKIEVSENIPDEKESTSLKPHSEQESEQMHKVKKKRIILEQDTTWEHATSIVFIIIFICLSIYFFILEPDAPINKIPEINKEEIKKNNEIENTYKKSNTKQEPKEEIEICQEGFYVPKGHQHCQKCSVNNCASCKGFLYRDKCQSCLFSFIPVLEDKRVIRCYKPCEIGENEKCTSCFEDKCATCHKGYNLINGTCILNHSIRAIYNATTPKENIVLINKDYIKYVEEMIIDGHPVQNISFNFTFFFPGIHTIIMRLNTTNLDNAKKMFSNINKLININFTRMFNTENMISMRKMFQGCVNLQSIGLTNFKTGKVEDFSFMFDGCSSLSNINVSFFDTKNAKDISNMFLNCKSLKSISLKNFVTDQVVDMGGLFSGCSSLSSIDLSSFKTDNAKFMLYMFSGCSSLFQLDISSFKTDKVIDISYMFNGCSKLNSLNLKNFSSLSVTKMEGTFMGCEQLTSIDLSNFQTPCLQNVNKMFFGCDSLKNIDISNLKMNSTSNHTKLLFDSRIGKDGKMSLTGTFYNIIKNNIPSGWQVLKDDSK